MRVTGQLDIIGFLAEEVQLEVKEKTKLVYKGVTLRTAVRTGQTVASWNVSKNEPNYITADEGTGLRAKPLTNLTFARNEFPTVFVSNGKRHAIYLEEGTDKMAPRPMVAPTLAGL